MLTIKQIEDMMAEEMLKPGYDETVKRFHELLAVMGNVDGDEIIALVLVAERGR